MVSFSCHYGTYWKYNAILYASNIIIIKYVFDVINTLDLWRRYLYTLCLKCINCKKETGLNSETNFTWFYDKIIAKFVLNVTLNHVGMSWIISSNKEMEYEMNTKINHLDWLNKGPWYKKKSVLNNMELSLRILLHRQEQTDIISCAL